MGKFKLRKPNPKGEDTISLHSIEGYKKDSPDKNNEINVIHSSTITMEDVPHDVLALDIESGKSKVMKKGSGIHKFPGDIIIETRI
tara:strand:+ start:2036 stop:2293 length:258 start_codon:yes stop_codon:yes gene_type:complete